VPETDINATAAALLGLLEGGPATGYDLVGAAQEFLGDFWTITRSQVYRELAAMAERGLVKAGDAGPRDRRPYAITTEGRASFDAWLHSDLGPEVVRVPLLLRLAFADRLDGDRLAELVADQRVVRAERLRCYRELEAAAVAGGTTDRQLLTLRFGIRYETGVLEWLDEVEGVQ
jgi:DNA-binding PadR family transcriptional regulator